MQYDLMSIISKRRNELISVILVKCNVMEAILFGALKNWKQEEIFYKAKFAKVVMRKNGQFQNFKKIFWHNRIHVKAMYRMSIATFGTGVIPNIFKLKL
ncbi:MAG TPA: hypothetical protein P5064_03780 [Clostridia bacterium]|jgi:hypothetical protein|nr:hypothetical protein [Clostridiaceae bacterium]HOF26130.1 hypothetical protein [Clostridia bacterium]HOM33923.1 hypothetical protein [Clostridia bacterium]HOR89500.1 hypothetical protein [Clostridia bacterium]HOT69809.1 hypothetical protein [Clostridia bacterium]